MRDSTPQRHPPEPEPTQLQTPTPTPTQPPGLGIDAGGTQTRWAVADAQGVLHGQGALPALSGLQLASAAGTAHIAAVLRDMAANVCVHQPQAAWAGITGLDAAHAATLQQMLADALGLAPHRVRALSDVELLCHAAFEPGAGCVVYAGTGSIAACVDAHGTLHRAGGRGAVIDDAGGGHWIARQALQHIWRAEDAAPGSSAQSALAQRVFAHIGGSDWASTRAWVYSGPGSARGGLGLLALAVAQAARDDGDAQALRILHDAGAELARLAQALLQRHGPLLHRNGPLPIALAGRVFSLHPAIADSLQAALPAGHGAVQRLAQSAHDSIERRAAQRAARWAATTADRTDA